MGALLAGAIVSGVGGLFNAFGAGRRRRRARLERQRRERELEMLENNRQDINDPYAGVMDVSTYASNPFTNLNVATQAAEFQATEQDISLANTLDTLRATGQGAGGATALAQAALRSKAGISASIEQQEVQNERLRAEGETRLQNIQMSEAQRVQQARSQGQLFMFQTREVREMQKLNRLAGLVDQAGAREQNAITQQDNAIGNLFGSVSGALMSGAFSGNKTNDTVGTSST